MMIIIGFMVVLGSVGGGFVLSHGHLRSLWQPNELIVIGGAALGAFLVANPTHVLVRVGKGIGALLGGAKYSKKSYVDLLALMFQIFTKVRRDGMMSIENDVEEPEQSELFKQYPEITKNHHNLEFILDYLRLMIGGNMNSYELENLMDVEIDTHHHTGMQPSGAVSSVAEGLPGFGIVAAVLGIVITMASLGGPVEAIGEHVGAALVGTFLGILLAYGFVGPVAMAMEYQAEEENSFFKCIKVCFVASLNGYTPTVSVEFGRKAISEQVRPGFYELEEHIKSKK